MKAGDILLVKFPFSDLETTKKRPALLLTQLPVTAKSSLLTIGMITSRIDGLKLGGDVRLMDWEDAGLLHPSLVRLAKIATIDSALGDKVLGKLTSADQERVKKELARHFRHWLGDG